jgi:dienelactone hydrolase
MKGRAVRSLARLSKATASGALLVLAAACAGGSGAPSGSGGTGTGIGDGSPPAVFESLLPGPAPLTPLAADHDISLTTTSWDLGTVTLDDGAPAPIRGVIAVPVTADVSTPAPLVVVLHGSHLICVDDPSGYGTWPCPEGTEVANEQGLTWLLEAFAARGAVVIAPALNVQYTYGAGEPEPALRTAEIVMRTLDALASGDLPVPSASVDTTRMVLAGHSLGGQDANLLARGFHGFDRVVAGLLLVQPALNVEDARELADVPTAVVISECDGDVGLAGGLYVSDRLVRESDAPVALVVLDGGSHNATNSLLRADSFQPESPTCDAQRTARAVGPDAWLQEAAGEQERLAELLPALLDAVLGAIDGDLSGVFDESRAPEDAHVSVVPAGTRAPLLPGRGERTIAEMRADGASLTWCPSGYYTPFTAPGSEPCHRPELSLMIGQPATVAVAWDRAGARVTVPIGTVDGGVGDVLRLRLFADPADVRLGDGPIVLRLVAQDGSTIEVTIPVPPAVRFTVDPFDVVGALLPWHTVRVRLGAPLEELTLEMVSPAQGSLQIVTLGLG